MKTILIIEDDVVFGRSIGNWLRKKGIDTAHVGTLSAARKELQAKEFDLVLADLRLPDGNSTELLEWMNGKYCSAPFFIMTNYGQVENAVEAMQLGAVNYLCKPVQPERLLEAIEKVFSRPRHDGTEFYRGESEKAREMYRQIGPVARSDMSVLLRGASGTGKEHIAAEIHEQSLRRNKPFIAVDCGTVTDELGGSEFFGHRKGSFTGADSDKVGLFHAAEGGTLFLDEIGNLTPVNQMKLLRALQEKRYLPVGTVKERPFDVRLVAATNADLEGAIAEGRFREDLYYRLNEYTIGTVTLGMQGGHPSARRILPETFSVKYRKEVHGFERLATSALQQYAWPGNIRELKNTVQRAVVFAKGGWISAESLKLDLGMRQDKVAVLSEEEKEKQLILATLERTGGNRARAARILGISRTSLYDKLKKYGIL